MAADSIHIFDAFRLDLANAQLWRGDEEIPLRRKTFDVLRYLVEHAGELVTRDVLLDTLWAGVNVSPTMPAICVGELRRAFGDDAKTPRLIETVHGRGYRFIAKLSRSVPASAAVALSAPALAAPRPIVVGRAAELEWLQERFVQACEGRRRVVFITGEAGIGKTTFANEFLASLPRDVPVRVARGQCIQQYGAGEPYMPILEVLTRLARQPGGDQLIQLLNQYAPSWLAQMPAFLGPADRARLQAALQGLTQPRMLRELNDALDAFTAESPLVLLLEDLHWSDFSTLDSLDALARWLEPSRLLLIATYRPGDILRSDHPLNGLKHELELHGQSEELRLGLLNRRDVEAYLKQRFLDDDADQLLRAAPMIHHRTEGNPLFMVNVIDYLLDHGSLFEADEIETPPTIQQMVARNFERLSTQEQEVLEAASVAGMEFSAAAVAAALDRRTPEIEAYCLKLSRREQFIDSAGSIDWPDGTVAANFRFHHTVYEDVLYERLPPSHRIDLHRRIAEREENAYGAQANEIAFELAHHYRHANERAKAIDYLTIAGEQALHRSAHAEAITNLSTALDLLDTLPDSPERIRRESRIQLALIPALVMRQGWVSPEVERATARAKELLELAGDKSDAFRAMFGLYALSLLKSDLRAALRFSGELRQIAASTKDPIHTLHAHNAVGILFYHLGRPVPARENLEISLDAYNRELDESSRSPAPFAPFDAGVACLGHLAAILWILGYPDQALQRANETLALANSLSHPFSQSFAEFFYCIVREQRREPQAVLKGAEDRIARGGQYEFAGTLAYGHTHRGWALAKQYGQQEGIEEIRQGLAMLEMRGENIGRAHWLMNLADACLAAERIDDGLEAVAAGLAQVAEHDSHFSEAELHRLKGELLLKRDETPANEARKCFERAIAIAKEQSAKSYELRATTSLARLLAQQGDRDDARAILAEIYHWFTEGFDTLDLQDAKALLDDLSAPPPLYRNSRKPNQSEVSKRTRTSPPS